MERGIFMAKKHFREEQIVSMLRQIEVQLSKGMGIEEACRQAGITNQTYYRWRKRYGGLNLDKAKRLRALEKENVRLKRVVADLTLDNQILKEVNSKNF